jgi:hypothetical protein
VSKVDLRLQCGMPCSKPEVSTVQHGTLSGAGYLHQSPTSYLYEATTVLVKAVAEVGIRHRLLDVPQPVPRMQAVCDLDGDRVKRH